MKKALFLLFLILLMPACKHMVNVEAARNEILQAESEFEKMASDKGVAEAFYYFASDNAVIRRGNDSLITGKENIKHYYEKNADPNAKITWTPDFVDVSDCGTLGYTFGKYVYSTQDSSGKSISKTGIFHTVWKKQNNDWRYVWD